MIVYAFRFASIFGGISSDLLMKSLTSTTASVFSSILRLTSMDAPYAKDIIKELKKTDLELKLKVLDAFIKENTGNIEKESVKHAINGVHEVLIDINKGLNALENATIWHNTKYFSSWRSLSCEYSIHDIKKHNSLLDTRTELLFKILKTC